MHFDIGSETMVPTRVHSSDPTLGGDTQSDLPLTVQPSWHALKADRGESDGNRWDLYDGISKSPTEDNMRDVICWRFNYQP